MHVKESKNKKASHSYRHAFMFIFFFSYFGGLLKRFRNQSFEYAWQKCNRKTVTFSKDHFSSMILWVIQQTCIMCLLGIQRWVSRAISWPCRCLCGSRVTNKQEMRLVVPAVDFKGSWGKLTLDTRNYFSYYIKKGLHFALWRYSFFQKKKKSI